MELDELQSLWGQQTAADVNVHKKKIVDMIQSKSYGPLAELKRIFKRAFLMIPLLAFMIIYTLINNRGMKDASMWMLIFMFIPFSIFYIYWYFMIGKLQTMALPLKRKIERDIAKIEKGLKWLYILVNITVIIMIVVLLEFTDRSHSVIFSKWHLMPIYLRYIAYIAFGVWAFSSNKKNKYFYFDRHLNDLKYMLSQME